MSLSPLRRCGPIKHDPIHPCEVLREDFILPLGLNEYRIAKDIGVPPRRIDEIVKGKRSTTADTASRLTRYFEWPAKGDPHLGSRAFAAGALARNRTWICGFGDHKP